MGITVEVISTSTVVEVYPSVTEVEIVGTSTEIEISTGIAPLVWGTMLGTLSDQTDLQLELDDKLDKSTEIQSLQGVSALPGTPAAKTIYFIIP